MDMYCYECRASQQGCHGDVEIRGFKERDGNEQEAENMCHRGADQSGHARLLRVSAVPAALLGKCS